MLKAKVVQAKAVQVSQEQATAWMAAAGLKPVEVIGDLFPDRWFVIYGK